MTLRRIKQFFLRVFLKMLLFVVRLLPANRNDPFLSRTALAGAGVGIFVYAWFSPPSFTAVGIFRGEGMRRFQLREGTGVHVRNRDVARRRMPEGREFLVGK
jgi:hypothetical protein